jgi:hypothetical protein
MATREILLLRHVQEFSITSNVLALSWIIQVISDNLLFEREPKILGAHNSVLSTCCLFRDPVFETSDPSMHEVFQRWWKASIQNKLFLESTCLILWNCSKFLASADMQAFKRHTSHVSANIYVTAHSVFIGQGWGLNMFIAIWKKQSHLQN